MGKALQKLKMGRINVTGYENSCTTITIPLRKSMLYGLHHSPIELVNLSSVTKGAILWKERKSHGPENTVLNERNVIPLIELCTYE